MLRDSGGDGTKLYAIPVGLRLRLTLMVQLQRAKFPVKLLKDVCADFIPTQVVGLLLSVR